MMKINRNSYPVKNQSIRKHSKSYFDLFNKSKSDQVSFGSYTPININEYICKKVHLDIKRFCKNVAGSFLLKDSTVPRPNPLTKGQVIYLGSESCSPKWTIAAANTVRKLINENKLSQESLSLLKKFKNHVALLDFVSHNSSSNLDKGLKDVYKKRTEFLTDKRTTEYVSNIMDKLKNTDISGYVAKNISEYFLCKPKDIKLLNAKCYNKPISQELEKVLLKRLTERHADYRVLKYLDEKNLQYLGLE